MKHLLPFTQGSEACSFTAADAGEPSLGLLVTGSVQMYPNELLFIKEFIVFSRIHLKDLERILDTRPPDHT